MKNLFLITVIVLATFFDTLSQEFEGSRSEKTAWYIGQRAYPYDTIPANAYSRAYGQKMALRQTQGYYLSTELEWKELGPKPLSSSTWQDVSARVADIEYDPSDPTGHTIYLAAGEGGIWKTVNNGLNWCLLDDQLPSMSSGCLTLDNQNHIIYYGTGGPQLYGLGVFKSTNGGLNWTSIWDTVTNPILPRTTCIYGMAIRPNHPNEIFVADAKGLFRTLDGGNSWTRVIPQEGQPARWCSDVAFSDENTVLAVGPKPTYFEPPFSGIGLCRSTDGGRNFVNLDQTCGFPHLSDDYARTQIATSISDSSVFYILTYYVPSTDNYVYKSTNYGQSFVVKNGGSKVYTTGENSGYNHFIRCHQATPDKLFVGFQDLLISTDGADSFMPVTGYMHKDFHCLAFNPYVWNQVICGNDGGIAMSSNGGYYWYWNDPVVLNHDLGISESWHVGSSFYNSDLVLCGLQDEGIAIKQSTNSTYWVSTSCIGAGDGTAILYSPFKSSTLVASHLIYWRPVYYSTNNLSTCGASISGDNRSTVVTPLAAHPKIPGIFYNVRNYGLGKDQVMFYTSTNDGQSFNYHTFPLISPDEGTPQNIAVSPSNPDRILFSIGDYSDFWNRINQIYRSTDGGTDFNKLLTVHPGIPDRYFTHLEFDPTDEHTFYVTLSGFGTGHVFRTTNDGTNWSDISGNLPDVPVNDLLIRYPDANTKELLLATDMGVYRSNAAEISWQELAINLPNTHIIDLDYNRLSNKLRAAAFGRGIWETQLPGDIYVKDYLYITDNTSINKNIVVCPNGKLILGHSAVPDPFTINFNQGSGIIVQDGGQIDASSGVAVTFTSQSGTWNGIELQGKAFGTLNNCTFNNTTVPIYIDGSNTTGPSDKIIIGYCTFNNNGIYINSRDNVTVKNCIFNIPQEPTYSGVNINSGNNINIYDNTIYGAQIGIIISSSNPYLSNNTINGGSPQTQIGISFINDYSPTINSNTVTDCVTGFDMINSSPTMYHNSSISNLPSGLIAVNATFQSSPRLTPTIQDGNTIWDAGANVLKSVYTGFGISLLDRSIPNIDYGYNTIFGAGNGIGYNHITGSIGDPEITEFYARCNSWDENPQESYFTINDATVIFQPYNCTPPGGGGRKEVLSSDILLASQATQPPPPPIIIDHGNGIYDTIKVSSGSHNASADQLLYSQAVKEELLGNYTNALNLYQQIILNYKDSTTAVNSLRHVLICYDKLHSDSAAYTNLRNYYHNLAQNNISDTILFRVANELATKTLVRKSNFIGAISEYENVIANSIDTLEILSTELNIISTYMLINYHGGGNAVQFTGKLAYLKPASKLDGFLKIRERIRKIDKVKKSNTIPKEFNLRQNYPNPFNPTTKIEYSLPQNTKVTIKVYDILGRLVKTLVDENKEAGYYTITFDGSNYASGVYFYRIEAGKFVQSKKMVLIK